MVRRRKRNMRCWTRRTGTYRSALAAHRKVSNLLPPRRGSLLLGPAVTWHNVSDSFLSPLEFLVSGQAGPWHKVSNRYPYTLDIMQLGPAGYGTRFQTASTPHTPLHTLDEKYHALRPSWVLAHGFRHTVSCLASGFLN